LTGSPYRRSRERPLQTLDVCRIGLCCLLVAGCNDTRDLAPASPDTPWRITKSVPGTDAAPAFTLPASTGLTVAQSPDELDPSHAYALPELVDIAERRDPTTRIAWEQARQAAINVGISQASYLPTLTASALAGYEHVASPFPPDLVPQGFITANAQEFLPELAVRYLLFDFGKRDAAVRGARALSFAANVQFTAAHQSLIFNVAHAYFTLDGVDAQLQAAQQTVASARLLEQAAEATDARGLGTVVDVAVARRNTAQARYDVTAAVAAQHDATYALLASMDLPPTTRLQIVTSTPMLLPDSASSTLNEMMRRALQQRPDLLADIARLRATDSEIAQARSDFYPTLSLSANIQGNVGRISVDAASYEDVEQPQAGIFLHLDWPLFAGGLLRNRLYLAQSQRAAAEDSLREGSEQALRQVALAYDQVDTGLSRYRAAVALTSAAQTASDAAREAYGQGVGTFTDAVNAQSSLSSALAAQAQARSHVQIAAASLAFATGALTSSDAFGPSAKVPPP
jgi:outer membrane protein